MRGTKKVLIPVFEKLHDIECPDAIVEWDDVELETLVQVGNIQELEDVRLVE